MTGHAPGNRVPVVGDQVAAIFWGCQRTGTVLRVMATRGRPAIGVVFDDATLPGGLRGRLNWYDAAELGVAT